MRIIPRTIVDLPGGRTIARAEIGTGPDLVAIHGTPMTLEDMWLGPVPALALHFRVVAGGRPGHGHSRRTGGFDASPWRQAELIHAAVRSLGLHRPVIVGHSCGGAVALAYGMLFPDAVAGIVALTPVYYLELRLEQVRFGPRVVPPAGADPGRRLRHRRQPRDARRAGRPDDSRRPLRAVAGHRPHAAPCPSRRVVEAARPGLQRS